MIIFHEGLPGAGKSYEACVKFIIPALLEGRKVFAYIEGLNHEKFAEVTKLPLKLVQNLLVQVERDQVLQIHELVAKDSLVIIDEVQNFWPTRQLSKEDPIIKFVAEHRHNGLDIVVMGQDMRDCNAIWKRRVEQKIVFTKLTAVGSDNRYRWQLYRAVSGEKFLPVTSGVETYKREYFGLYSSHTKGTLNTRTFKDSRAVIWKHPALKYGVPLFVVLLFYGVNGVYSFFHPETFSVQAETSQPDSFSVVTPTVEPVVGSSVTGAGNSVVAPVAVELDRSSVEDAEPLPSSPGIEVQDTSKEIDLFVAANDKWRARLSGSLIASDRVAYVIEFYDNSYRLQQRFTSDQLELMGWDLQVSDGIGKITRDNVVIFVNSWPIEPLGQVSRQTAQQL